MDEKKKNLVDDEIILAFLDNATEEAKRSIKQGGRLTTELAIPLMLKSQFNHIAHLEEQMVTKKEFNVLKEQFNGLKEQFNGLKEQFNGLKEQFNGLKEQFNGLKEQVGFIKWMILFGFTLLAALQVYTMIFK